MSRRLRTENELRTLLWRDLSRSEQAVDAQWNPKFLGNRLRDGKRLIKLTFTQSGNVQGHRKDNIYRFEAGQVLT